MPQSSGNSNLEIYIRIWDSRVQAVLAQSVERKALNLVVGGSSPPVERSWSRMALTDVLIRQCLMIGDDGISWRSPRYDAPVFTIAVVIYVLILVMLTFCFSKLMSIVAFTSGCYAYS
eukprot:scaffold6125_cov262-Ochromonas_danica.AAC.11